MNIVIVGGGFGGVKTALELSKSRHVNITLISDEDDFCYFPALYSAATGHSHLASWVPLKEIFSGVKNVELVKDTITKVDSKSRSVSSKSGVKYGYDKLVLSLGTVTTYFGIEGLDSYSYGIKSVEEIKELKKHLQTSIADSQTTEAHYVIIGAGPTGVELAAALGSYLNRICKHYQVDQGDYSIELIEAAPRVLPRMSQKTSDKVVRRLTKLGVNVQVDKKVESASVDGIMVSGKPLKSHTVIWTSGVANNPFYKDNADQFEFDERGRIKVDSQMRASENVYVIGDNASTEYSGLAQTALHDAIFLATNLRRKIKGAQPKKYKAVMPPVVVPVGESWAVFEWHKLRIYGWPAAIVRKLADFIGYHDILPIGQALGVWRAEKVIDDDYVEVKRKKRNR